MKIAELAGRDEARFEELALAHGSIFNTSRWTGIFGESIRRYGIYHDGGELIGGFIIYTERRFGLSICRNPPFTPSIGPFLKVEATNLVAVMDLWKKALSLMAAHIDRLGFSVVSISLDREIVDTQPFIWRKNKVVPEYTYVLDLTRSLDELKSGMSGERRKNITKGLKDGLVVKHANDYGMIKSLVLKTFERQRKAVDCRYLDRILFDFADRDNSFAFLVFKEDIPMACSFCIHDRRTAYYILGGYDSGRKHHGAGALAMWEAIGRAKELGMRYFDFEGSMIPPVETYFRGFGGRLTPCYRVNKALLPLEMMLKLFKRELF